MSAKPRPATTHAPPALRARPELPPEVPTWRQQLPLFLELPRQVPPALWWHSSDAPLPSPDAAMRSLYIGLLLELRRRGETPPPPPPLGELVAFWRAGRWYWRAPELLPPPRTEEDLAP